MDAAPDWYRRFFDDDDYLLAARSRPVDEALRQVEFAVEHLGLEPGMHVLDVPCGHGRHAIELARRGLRVTGVDLSPPALALAARLAEEAGVDVELVRADMRELPLAGEADAGVNLFTSFGYLESEEEDARALAAMARALRPGGRFLMETINPLWVIRHMDDRGWHELEDGTLLLEERRLDLEDGRMTARWEFVARDGSRRARTFRHRLYTVPELRRMLGAAGLEPDGTWGGADGAPYGVDSRRLLVRATKPAA